MGRARCLSSGLLCLLTFHAPATAGIIINEYQTTAETNAWAPLTADQYFQKQTLTNVSPAAADAAGDWTGTNVGGTDITWHWVGHGHMQTTTSLSANALAITGSGFFSSDLTTFPGFLNPNFVKVLYVPGSGGSYSCEFTTDSPIAYTASAELWQWSRMSFASFDTGYIFDAMNQTPTPVPAAFGGTLPAGHYFFSAGAGLGGVHINSHDEGSLANFIFSAQVPEPGTSALVLTLIVCRRGRRNKALDSSRVH
jgi:hypothetical protein